MGRNGTCVEQIIFAVPGVFSKNDNWDITAEYAKNAPQDIFCKITGIVDANENCCA